jgi:hypothetical protein
MQSQVIFPLIYLHINILIYVNHIKRDRIHALIMNTENDYEFINYELRILKTFY